MTSIRIRDIHEKDKHICHKDNQIIDLKHIKTSDITNIRGGTEIITQDGTTITLNDGLDIVIDLRN